MRKSKFTRTFRLTSNKCPLSPATGKTKFSSVDTFLRMCLVKQNEVVFWDSTRKKNVPKHPQCKVCKQGKASQKGRIMVVLNEIGIYIDEGMITDGGSENDC